jgi:VRR-NUC domain
VGWRNPCFQGFLAPAVARMTALSPIERRLHCAVVDLLAVAAAPDVWFSHLPAGEFRRPETARLLQRLGLRRGLPDLMFVDRSGVAFLELKRRGAKPTPEQAAFLERCRKAGIRCAIADSFDQAVAVLREWGVLSDRVKV